MLSHLKILSCVFCFKFEIIFSMSINTSDISKFRELTGAGMMDCKKALDEAGGDMEKAAEILRKKGIMKAAKREGKIAAEGLTNVAVSGNFGVVLELNSETDFVAKNDNFKKLLEEITSQLLNSRPANLEEAQGVAMPDGQKLSEYLTTAAATIGEKISLRRFAVMEKNDTEAFGAYIHMGGKISVLAVLTGTTDAELGREVAMHIAAANPKYVKREEVPTDILDKEREIYSEQLKAQGKPANIIENILKGKVDKYYGEVCLLEQAYIKDEEKTVQKFLDSKGAGITVVKMARFELGEGIEKKSNDFAAEVAEQLK